MSRRSKARIQAMIRERLERAEEEIRAEYPDEEPVRFVTASYERRHGQSIPVHVTDTEHVVRDALLFFLALVVATVVVIAIYLDHQNTGLESRAPVGTRSLEEGILQ